jgi:micrococcal nuclease
VQPRGPVDSGVPVSRVVDGDTIQVLLAGRDTTVRLVGINTPETVKPDSPVECFGPEASEYAKQALTGQTVTLEYDDSQGRVDRYGRTLAYAWIELPEGGLDLFNLDAVAGGYAQERQYGPNRFAWQDLFRAAEQRAQAAGAGMWTACPAHS